MTDKEHESGEPYLGDMADLPETPILGNQEVHDIYQESELEGGARLENLQIGKTLVVQTKNSAYRIQKTAEGFLISGNAEFCPVPTVAQIAGSSFGGATIRLGFVGKGLQLEYYIGKLRHLTSPIQNVYEE